MRSLLIGLNLLAALGCGARVPAPSIVGAGMDLHCRDVVLRLWPDGEISDPKRKVVLGRVDGDELLMSKPAVRCSLDARGRLVNNSGADCFDGLIAHLDDPPIELTVDAQGHVIRIGDERIARLDGDQVAMSGLLGKERCTIEGYRPEADRAAMLLVTAWTVTTLGQLMARI